MGKAGWLLGAGLACAGLLTYLAQTHDDAGARLVMDGYLAAPGSARYLRNEVIASTADWRMAHVVVDSQNQMGALLRGSFCVVYQVDGDHVRWNRDTAVTECGNPPAATAIDAVKCLSGWPGALCK